MDERIILRTMNEGEMSRRLPVNPLLSRHFEGIILRWSGRGSRCKYCSSDLPEIRKKKKYVVG